MSSVIRGSDNFDSRRFVSAEQTITSAGLLTVPHGLGVEPSSVEITMICKIADQGWLVGDVIRNVVTNGTSAATNRLSALYSDATNISLRFSSNATPLAVSHKASGDFVAAANNSWRVIFRAKA